MTAQELLHTSRPVIAFQRHLAEAAGSATGGLWLSQAIYLTTVTTDENGWFWRSWEKWEQETYLSRKEQATIRTKLKSLGILDEKVSQCMDRTIHYRLNLDRLAEICSHGAMRCAKSDNAMRQIGHSIATKGAMTNDIDLEKTYKKKEDGAEALPAQSVPIPSTNSRMVKPTAEQIQTEAIKIDLSPIEAEKFQNYYESNGWRVGKNPMKSWTAALRTWKMNGNRYSSSVQ
ncbi:MAG: hypothetical protein KGJ13_10400, partial [Patescibacteria group bacterium]|nr:hypothetical protein [Patescibacteria group bacterium]